MKQKICECGHTKEIHTWIGVQGVRWILDCRKKDCKCEEFDEASAFNRSCTNK